MTNDNQIDFEKFQQAVTEYQRLQRKIMPVLECDVFGVGYWGNRSSL